MNTKKENKKILKIIGLASVLLIFSLFITGTLSLGSLYGGDSENKYGGNFTANGEDLLGSTTTSFASINVDHIDFSITNNAVNGDKTIVGLPYSVERYTIGTSETTTDYQMKITLTKKAGMNSDLSNVRFSETDGTPIPQYRESYITDTSAIYWIKTDLEGGKNIDIAYGGDLPLKSNPEEVFDLYDGFDGNSIDASIWNVNIGSGDTATVSDGLLKFTLIDSGDARSQPALDSKTTFSIPIIVEYKTKLDFSGTTDGTTAARNCITLHPTANTHWDSEANKIVAYNSWRGLSTNNWQNGVSGVITDYVVLNNQWVANKIQWKSEDSKLWRNEDSAISGTTVLSPTSSLYLGIHYTIIPQDAIGTQYIDVDYIRVRKYLPTEPTFEPALGIDLMGVGYQFSNAKVLTIDNTENPALTNYQHLQTIAYESTMQADMDDLVFTELDGTIIPHYTESVTDSTEAEVFIKLLADADSTKQIIMYYGNSIVPDMSDSDVFDFYFGADSTEEVTTKFTGDTGSVTVSDGIADLYSATSTKDIWSIQTFSPNCILEANQKFGVDVFGFRNSDDANGIFLYSPSEAGSRLYTKKAGSISEPSSSYTRNDFSIKKFVWTDTSAIFYDNDVEMTNSPVTSNIPTVPITINLRAIDNSEGNNNYIDWIRVRQYTATPPSITFGTGKTLFNPTFTTSVTDDTNEQAIGSTATFTLTPTSDIDNFVVDGSLDYDFTATLYYSGDTTINAENATEGTMNFSFTPDVSIVSGYANAKFTENVTIENPSITATLDNETVNAVFENNTISVELINCNTSEHIVLATITNNPTPVAPSSGGGGGSSYVPPVEETTEDVTINEDVSITNTQTTDSKQNLKDYIEMYEPVLFIFLFAIMGIFGYVIMKKK